MENRTLFLIYLAVWVGYLAVIYSLSRWKRQEPFVVSFSHLVPSAIAVMMIGIFLIGRGATIAQFAAGSESAMDLWSLWFRLWPVLLIAAGVSALAHFAWTLSSCFSSDQRKWIPISLSGLAMSIFGWFTVAANFPDA